MVVQPAGVVACIELPGGVVGGSSTSAGRFGRAMEDGCDRTVEIQLGLDRLRLGDFSAIERLLAISTERLTRIAAKMLKDFPGVGRWEQSDDVAQNVVIRLDRALRSVTPATPATFSGWLPPRFVES